MQDDQIGPKIVPLAPADIITKNSSKQSKSVSWDYNIYLELALLYWGNRLFLTRRSPCSSKISMGPILESQLFPQLREKIL
jgi:hypothetical protein